MTPIVMPAIAPPLKEDELDESATPNSPVDDDAVPEGVEDCAEVGVTTTDDEDEDDERAVGTEVEDGRAVEEEEEDWTGTAMLDEETGAVELLGAAVDDWAAVELAAVDEPAAVDEAAAPVDEDGGVVDPVQRYVTIEPAIWAALVAVINS